MSFPHSQKHRDAQKTIRDFTQKEVASGISGFDRKQALVSFTCEEFITKDASFRVPVAGSETLGFIQARFALGQLPAYRQG